MPTKINVTEAILICAFSAVVSVTIASCLGLNDTTKEAIVKDNKGEIVYRISYK